MANLKLNSFKKYILALACIVLLCPYVSAAACSPYYSNSTSGEFIVKFNTTGVCQWTAPTNMTVDNPLWILIVAGGGSGGGNGTMNGGGGGGGGGGTWNGTVDISGGVIVNGTSYNVLVGLGGRGIENATCGKIGQNSSFANTTAGNGYQVFGGGGGGSFDLNGCDGGSGGGAGGSSGVTTYGGAYRMLGYGLRGGNNTNTTVNGAGGGGRSGLAGDSFNATTAGNGGAGLLSGITGTNLRYGAGGGGGAFSTGSTGGTGGTTCGGNGGVGGLVAATNGLDERGCGGGGNGQGVNYSAGYGGNGTVIIRYYPLTTAAVADFTQNVTYASIFGVVQFNSTSLNASSFLWEFGDGNTSTEENPTYSYSNEGNYTVTLFVNNGIGSNTTIKYQTITITNPPYVPLNNPDFEYGNGTATSSGSWIGNEKYGYRIAKSSNADDTYVMFDANESYSGSQSIKLNATAQAFANITRVQTGGTQPTYANHHFILIDSNQSYNVTAWVKTANLVNYTTSFLSITTGPNGSTLANISSLIVPLSATQDWTRESIIYNNSIGNFEGVVGVEIRGNGTMWIDDIKVMRRMTVTTTSNVTSGTRPFTVTFNSTITNGTPTYGYWSFGDGDYSSSYNATHTYTSAGIYNVSFTAANGDNYENPTTAQNITITAYTIIANFTMNRTFGYTPLVVQFTDTSNVTPVYWNWSFGDGTYSNSQNPVHTYSNAGVYNVILNASNNSIYSNITKQVTVYDKLYANFTKNADGCAYPCALTFTNNSTGGPTNYTWYFGDEDYTDPWVLVNGSSGWDERQSARSVTLLDGSILLIAGDITFYGQSNEVWRSIDNGSHWSLTNTSLQPFENRSWTAAVVANDGSILLSGGDGATCPTSPCDDVWRSTDKGTTWTEVNSSIGYGGSLVNHQMASFNDGSILIMGGSGGGNGIMRSTDYGATWTIINSSSALSKSAFASVVQSNQDVIIMDANSVWKSTDRGYTWTMITNTSLPDMTDAVAINMPDDSIILFHEGDTVRRSTNDGLTWSIINSSSGLNRDLMAATLLPNGEVIVMGGANTTTDVRLNDTWKFNPSGSTSNVTTHTFSSYGIYPVRLEAFNLYTFNVSPLTSYSNISVHNSTTNSFSSNVTTVYTLLPVTAVQFTSATANTTFKNWSFGDGNWSNITNGTDTIDYVYSGYGNFLVTLYTSEDGYGVCSTTSYINILYSMGTLFTASPTSGTAPLSVVFTDMTSTSPTAWNWSFGDGTYSNLQNPNHTFSSAGVYTVILNASNAYGFGNTSMAISVSGSYPVASFSADTTYGAPPLTVQFTDASSTTGSTSYLWDFGDGNTSTDQSPSYIYSYDGDYNVTLTVTDTIGIDVSDITVIHVSSSSNPFVNFIANTTSGYSPLVVSFTDLTTNIIPATSSWNWSFGDGNYSTSRNPVHTYVSDGQYTVRLTVINDSFSNYTIKTGYININLYGLDGAGGVVYADFVASPTYVATTPADVTFVSTSVCNPVCTAWSWDFNGDGAIDSVGQTPTYTYTYPGNYSPRLIVSNGYNSGTKVKIHYVTIGPIYSPTTIPQPTTSWTPTYQNGTYQLRTYNLDIANSTYLKYWLQNLTATGNFSIYGFSLGILAPIMHVFGFWIFLIIWMLYLASVWIRSQDVTLPLVIGILSIGTFGLLFPKEAFVVIVVMFAICGGVILYKTAKEW